MPSDSDETVKYRRHSIESYTARSSARSAPRPGACSITSSHRRHAIRARPLRAGAWDEGGTVPMSGAAAQPWRGRRRSRSGIARGSRPTS